MDELDFHSTRGPCPVCGRALAICGGAELVGDRPIATERTVVTGPDGIDRVVAKGDFLDVVPGYVQNTPNKVDAAANMEVADAADQAADNPPERIVQHFGASAEELAEIHARVAKNTEAFQAEQDASNAQPGDSESQPADSANATDGAKKLAASESIDLADVTGTGAQGRVTQGDVEKAVSARKAEADAQAQAEADANPGD